MPMALWAQPGFYCVCEHPDQKLASFCDWLYLHLTTIRILSEFKWNCFSCKLKKLHMFVSVNFTCCLFVIENPVFQEML